MPQPQRCQIPDTSATNTTTHGNAGSLTHRASPGIEPASSWILARFIFAEPMGTPHLHIFADAFPSTSSPTGPPGWDLALFLSSPLWIQPLSFLLQLACAPHILPLYSSGCHFPRHLGRVDKRTPAGCSRPPGPKQERMGELLASGGFWEPQTPGGPWAKVGS